MSRPTGRPIGWREALKSRAMDPLRFGWLHLPPKRRSARELAFRQYRFEVRRILRSEPSRFAVLGSRVVAAGERSKVVAVTLAAGTPVRPADLLYLWWRNHPGVLAAASAAGLPGWYWTTPLPYRSSHLQRAEPNEQLSTVYDLGEGIAQPATRTRRIEPRLYTAASGGDGVVELHITSRADWAKRASSFLVNAKPGDEITGWIFPHPHRLPAARPGLAVVTGSGAAAVFAALRSGATGVRLVWGLGDKRLEPWVHEELTRHETAGSLEESTILHSPERATDRLAERAGEVRRLIESGGWVYISGNEGMGAAADAIISDALGEELHRLAVDELRYIVST